MLKKVLIIMENPDVCKKIEQALRNETMDVCSVLTVHDGIKQLINYQFCLVIMDIVQSEIDGMELLKMIRQIRSVPILVLSSKAGAVKRVEVIRAGAQAYMENPYDLEICLAYAQSLMELYARLYSDKDQCYTLVFGGDLLINPVKRQAILKGEPMNLTKTEFDLLFYIASHAGQVLSREQIYRAVWNEDSVYNIDEAVKAHIKSLRKKLLPLGKEYIRNERGVGYRFSSEEDDK